MQTALSVNVNKVALLRNAREGLRPDLLDCCRTILRAGAQGITVHPRPDQRHIRPDDVFKIRDLLGSENVEYNIEGNADAGKQTNGYPGFLALIKDSKPNQCTLVPDSQAQLTSDHGFDLSNKNEFEKVRSHVSRIHELGTRVSLFLDPDIQLVELAKETGADRIELYTGPWADLVHECGLQSDQAENSLEKYANAARHASSIGLGVNAGHDLDLNNLSQFCSKVAVSEVSIGHALIADALDFGLYKTVQKYLAILSK